MNAKNQPEMESFDAAELGAMMREMRENLGHDLDAVARDLRIRLVYLEAIESGRLADLPGNAYVSGFLRSYSDFLGLEGEEIVRRFKMAGAEISSQPQLHLPSPVEEGRLPTASILLVAAVIAAAAYGGWYYLSGSGKGPMETVASLPKELSGLVDDAKNQTAPIEVAKSPAAPAAASDTGNTVAQPTDAGPTETPEPAGTTETVAAAQPAETSSGATTVEDTTANAQPAAEMAPTAETPAADNTASSPATTPASPAETAATTLEQSAPVSVQAATEPAPTPKPIETPTAAAVTPPTVTPPTPAADNRPAETVAAAAPTPAASTTAPSAAPTATTDNAIRTAAVAPSSAPASAASSASAPQTPAPRPETVPEAPSDPAPAQTASRPSSDTDTTATSSGGSVRIVVRAIADSYVAVRTSDNQPLFSQLMRRGDSYEVPSGADLVLETGNAGGLQITVGGKRAPALGPVGEIRRNIPMDAEKLLRGIN